MAAWVHAGPAVLAAFLASFVEFVEALTIVLAVGAVRGWKCTLVGVITAAAVLGAAAFVFSSVLQSVHISWVQIIVGPLLLLFGMRWLRKAILRCAQIVPRHDETAAFAFETGRMKAAPPAAGLKFDTLAALAAFKAVALDGAEVVFIVIAAGSASRTMAPAALGACAAASLVVVIGLMLRRPLEHIPENSLKFIVGGIIAGFGIFWSCEGLGFHWPAGDVSLPVVIGTLLIAAVLAARFADLQQRLVIAERHDDDRQRRN